MLEYKLPDLGKDNELFRKMHPEDLYKMRNDIQNHLNLILAASQEALDNNIESCCDICASYGYAYMDLPTGWGWLDEGTLMCSKCINRWEERFGEKPHLNREMEIEYEQYGSLSEDSAHRGQANFEFV